LGPLLLAAASYSACLRLGGFVGLQRLQNCAQIIGHGDSQSGPAAAILPGSMGKKKATAAKRWRVSILRSRAHYIGVVEAPDLRAAEATAARAFKLSTEDRRRLAVRELD